MAPDWPIRRAKAAEISALAQLWSEVWRDSHAAISPPELVRVRTEESFRDRLAVMGDRLRVAGPDGAPLGFCAVREGEIYQLFVSRAAQGSGLARRLLEDGEARLRAAGAAVAILDCLIGNHRAGLFYEKCGWRLRGEEVVALETSQGPLPVRTRIFEKRLV